MTVAWPAARVCAAARAKATVVFPLPPFCDTTATVVNILCMHNHVSIKAYTAVPRTVRAARALVALKTIGRPLEVELPITEAKGPLSALVAAAQSGERVVITKHGWEQLTPGTGSAFRTPSPEEDSSGLVELPRRDPEVSQNRPHRA